MENEIKKNGVENAHQFFEGDITDNSFSFPLIPEGLMDRFYAAINEALPPESLVELQRSLLRLPVRRKLFLIYYCGGKDKGEAARLSGLYRLDASESEQREAINQAWRSVYVQRSIKIIEQASIESFVSGMQERKEILTRIIHEAMESEDFADRKTAVSAIKELNRASGDTDRGDYAPTQVAVFNTGNREEIEEARKLARAAQGIITDKI